MTADEERGARLQVPVERAIDHCRVFANGVRQPGEYRVESALAEVAQSGSGFVWLGLHEPNDAQMATISEQFGIHELIVEDAVTAHQRPKVERYDDQLFIVVRSIRYTDDEDVLDSREIIESGEVQILIGPNFIITVRHQAEIPDLTEEMDRSPEIYENGPSALAWRVADFHMQKYVQIAGLLEREVDELEAEVFSPGTDFNVDKIYMYKREILEMRHATDPLAPALSALIKENKDLIPKQIRSYFRDVLDNEMQVKDTIGGFDERLTSLIDASVAKVSMQQNKDMRTISAVVGILAAPTLIAGIYGMNFDVMPELHWDFGYYAVLLLIAGVMAFLWWWFRRNDWL